MNPLALSVPAFAIAAMISLAAGPASAQDLSATISCLHGNVPASDFAQFGAKLRETNWDNSGGVALVSEIGGLKLRVLDPSGNSVCDETANNSTSCRFKVDLAAFEEFDVVVDNVDIPQRNSYKICSF